MVMHEATNYSPTTEDAAADALNAGSESMAASSSNDMQRFFFPKR
jgi:hypothetical protein